MNNLNVGIVGAGLIGGSLAKAYSEYSHNVYIYDQDKDLIQYAGFSGVSKGELTTEKLPSMNLIFISLYPSDSIEYLKENSKYFDKDTVVIDCCGTKRKICEVGFKLAEEYGYTFIGGHPMAGTQNSGFNHSWAHMYKGAPMVLVLPEKMDKYTFADICEFLSPCNFGTITPTSAEEHDQIIAFTSQLAHVVSNAYVKSPTARVHKGISAGSYKDLTRVAKLNEYMWTDLFMENANNLEAEINQIIMSLTEYRDAIRHKDADRLMNLLKEGRILKEEIDGKF